jgi:hypothetical protein
LKPREHKYAVEHYVLFAITNTITMTLFFAFLDRSLVEGVILGVLAGLATLYWWRPSGPGRRRLESRDRRPKQW